MVISRETASLVASIKEFSHGKLQRADDLSLLIQLSRLHNLDQVLDDLSFLAKFLTNSTAAMNRIGKEGEGYVELSREFTENLEKALTFVRLLVKEAPDDVKHRFTSSYFGMTPDALSALLQLLHDVSWLKNWNIDHRSAGG